MPKVKSYEEYAREILGVNEPDKLDKYQKQKNRVDYQRYAANYMAEQNKNTQLSEINKAKEKSLAESAIASERARRYVEAVNKHYGIAGTGYAANKAIDLYVQEANRRAEINNNYDKEKNAALTAYQNAITQNELNASGSMAEIEGYEDEANEAKRQEYVAKLQEIVENPETTEEDFLKYYNAYGKYLGEDDTLLKDAINKRQSDIDFESIKDKATAEVASTYGVKLGNAVKLDDLMKDKLALGDFKDTGEQTALINTIINLTRTRGADSLEGKAFDVNYGAGHDYYYYSNGVFYDISKNDARKIGIVEIDTQGNIIDKKQQSEEYTKKVVRETMLQVKESGFNMSAEAEKKQIVNNFKKYFDEDEVPAWIKASKYW